MRRETYVYDLLSRDGLVLRRLEHVAPGGHLSGNSNARIRWSGSITYTGTISQEEWYAYRIRPTLVVNGAETPLGVYVVRPSQSAVTATSTVLTLDLYDRTFIPASDAVDDTFSIPAGVVVTDAVREILASTGETNVAITRDATRLPSGLVWEPGTSKLTIINDLLASVGYSALWCDFTGAYRVAPYIPPSARPIAHTFNEDSTSIHSPDWVRKQDALIPNKIVCISQETSDTPAMRSVALNEDPASPYSFQSQGVWVAETHTGCEAATQAVLDATARRYLASAVASATVQRSMLTTPIDLATAVISHDGRREVVENIDITLTPTSLMTITSREVAS